MNKKQIEEITDVYNYIKTHTATEDERINRMGFYYEGCPTVELSEEQFKAILPFVFAVEETVITLQCGISINMHTNSENPSVFRFKSNNETSVVLVFDTFAEWEKFNSRLFMIITLFFEENFESVSYDELHSADNFHTKELSND